MDKQTIFGNLMRTKQSFHIKKKDEPLLNLPDDAIKVRYINEDEAGVVIGENCFHPISVFTDEMEKILDKHSVIVVQNVEDFPPSILYRFITLMDAKEKYFICISEENKIGNYISMSFADRMVFLR